MIEHGVIPIAYAPREAHELRHQRASVSTPRSPRASARCEQAMGALLRARAQIALSPPRVAQYTTSQYPTGEAHSRRVV